MAIEDIFAALDEQADAEIEEIRSAAATRAEAIGQEARAEAERITASTVESAEAIARLKSEKRLNAAIMQMRRDMATVRDEAIQRAFERASERLADLRGTPQYEGIFAGLLAEATQAATGECEILVDPADRELAARLVAGLGNRCPVVPEINTIGGLSVSQSNGRVLFVNTFESRIAKLHEVGGATIAGLMSTS
jgi:V/A-type H+/Na+-transporting ATPase subunit E